MEANVCLGVAKETLEIGPILSSSSSCPLAANACLGVAKEVLVLAMAEPPRFDIVDIVLQLSPLLLVCCSKQVPNRLCNGVLWSRAASSNSILRLASSDRSASVKFLLL
jgi:hypothetical protein